MNSTITLCSRYLHWIDNDHKRSIVFQSGDIEPGSMRGGLAGEFLVYYPQRKFFFRIFLINIFVEYTSIG